MTEEINNVDTGEYNTVEAISIEDLPISDLTFIGMRVCGTGLMIVIGAITILKTLKSV